MVPVREEVQVRTVARPVEEVAARIAKAEGRPARIRIYDS